MMDILKVMKTIAVERPAGTAANNRILDYLNEQFRQWGFGIRSLPFDCLKWQYGDSCLNLDGRKITIHPSPFSQPFRGCADIVTAGSLNDLKNQDCRGKIIALVDAIAQNSIQPKEYPFYYPAEHKELIDILETSGAAAVLAVTGEHPVYGLDPFYMFEDGNFLLPSAYISAAVWRDIERLTESGPAHMVIDSQNVDAVSRQLIAAKHSGESRGTIVVCAHMDCKYGVPGALDNGAGLVMMMRIMELIKNKVLSYDVEFVPFSSHEYFGATSELVYHQDSRQRGMVPALVINLDCPAHAGSSVAVSSFNLSDNVRQTTERLFQKYPLVSPGEIWYSGDHAPYAAQGIPCLAVASSDFFTGGLKTVHTKNDTLDTVDPILIEAGAVYLAELLELI